MQCFEELLSRCPMQDHCYSLTNISLFSGFYLSLVANYAANVTLEFTNDSVNAVAGVPLSNIATSLTLGFCWKHFAEFKDHCYVRLAQVEGKLRCAETNEKYLVRGSNQRRNQILVQRKLFGEDWCHRIIFQKKKTGFIFFGAQVITGVYQSQIVPQLYFSF